MIREMITRFKYYHDDVSPDFLISGEGEGLMILVVGAYLFGLTPLLQMSCTEHLLSRDS